ncbi:MAG: spore coat associated protein CotJA [Eubacterium sp.]|nr:spore coat associated protein CotJA [Eubacterium sp.]MDD7209318.1 spore coat associated protein CotJA [Lachnospiraceae bacterium]MDY5498144.1 spore coat associated protein CotJA [Anaerobutyricum sp.]
MERTSHPSCQSGKETMNFDTWPIAMAYVPWQRWQKIYKPEEGLAHGTIFQELDLPFTGRRCQKS